MNFPIYAASTATLPMGPEDDEIAVADGMMFPHHGGWAIINRVDANGVSTPMQREFIYFSGTDMAQSKLVGVVRGACGTSSYTHAAGSIIEVIDEHQARLLLGNRPVAPMSVLRGLLTDLL